MRGLGWAVAATVDPVPAGLPEGALRRARPARAQARRGAELRCACARPALARIGKSAHPNRRAAAAAAAARRCSRAQARRGVELLACARQPRLASSRATLSGQVGAVRVRRGCGGGSRAGTNQAARGPRYEGC